MQPRATPRGGDNRQRRWTSAVRSSRVSGRIGARGPQIGVAVGLLDDRKRDPTDGETRTVRVAGGMRHRTVGRRSARSASSAARVVDVASPAASTARHRGARRVRIDGRKCHRRGRARRSGPIEPADHRRRRVGLLDWDESRVDVVHLGLPVLDDGEDERALRCADAWLARLRGASPAPYSLSQSSTRPVRNRHVRDRRGIPYRASPNRTAGITSRWVEDAPQTTQAWSAAALAGCGKSTCSTNRQRIYQVLRSAEGSISAFFSTLLDDEEFGDLDGVEGSALAQVVVADDRQSTLM